MIDYIDRQAAMDALEWKWAGKAALDAIKELPSAEVEPVKHGRWVDDDLYADNHLFHVWRCSKCDKNMMVKDSSQEVGAPWFKYCPNCGAKMDLEEEEKMTPIITTINGRDLGYVTTGTQSIAAAAAYTDFIKTYEPEGVRKAEELPKKEPMIDHKFLEMFERIMKKDITMRKKVTHLVDKVMVHGPALIVFWKDGSKTVVKCANEEFDLEKGIAMAFIKRMFGNKGNYNAFLNFIINSWTY